MNVVRYFIFAATAALAWTGTALGAAAVPANIAAAVADPGRPATDTQRDANRKPAETLAFAKVKAGEKVLEILPGGGYYTRIFSKAIGPSGHLYELVPAPPPGVTPPPDAKAMSAPIEALAKDPAYPNITLIEQPFTSFTLPEQVDLAWTSDNYHDLHLKRIGLDVSQFDKAVFAALKPGGIFIVLDHAAAKGAGISDVDSMHRIDEAFVKKEVSDAGFKLIGESKVLRNPADKHDVAIFDASIRGKTDQFLLAFQKPAQ